METGTTVRAKLAAFGEWLLGEEKCRGTIRKYQCDMGALAAWLGDRELTHESAAEWKEHLQSQNYAPSTVNSMLAALNTFCAFAELNVRVRFMKLQKKIFCEPEAELTRPEYERLIGTALAMGKKRLALLMETICASGIRVSELRFITVDAARSGRATVSMKGKVRSILLPGKLCKKLTKYAKEKKIASGEIFLTGSGRSISRCQIWSEMKRLCKDSGVEESKVFPHNLRHLFAATFYHIYKDVVRLADVLGHSSVDTTRIYLVTSGKEHMRQLEKMGLVS